MANRNICLTTYFNEDYALISQFCLLSLKKYSAKFGYPIILRNHLTSNRYPPWNKILVIKKLFAEGYDYVFYVDADAMIVRFDQDIAKQIEPNKEWYLSRQQKEFQQGSIPNTGIMLIKNTNETKIILDQIWHLTDYSHHYWADQAAFIELAGLRHQLPAEFQNYIKDKKTESKLVNSIKWLDESWNENQHFASKNTKIIHLFGARQCYKLWHLNRFAYKYKFINTQRFIKNALHAIVLRLNKK